MVESVKTISECQRLLTINDLADILQVSVSTIYAWRARGTAPRAYRVGRHLRFHPDDITYWLERQEPR